MPVPRFTSVCAISPGESPQTHSPRPRPRVPRPFWPHIFSAPPGPTTFFSGSVLRCSRRPHVNSQPIRTSVVVGPDVVPTVQPCRPTVASSSSWFAAVGSAPQPARGGRASASSRPSSTAAARPGRAAATPMPTPRGPRGWGRLLRRVQSAPARCQAGPPPLLAGSVFHESPTIFHGCCLASGAAPGRVSGGGGEDGRGPA